ncbi:MAG: hypothetical protein HYS27_05490 [Deltaproteobacteria bacterium]|nr:hypothetical protein [Deltaproteobacteria bacterium]
MLATTTLVLSACAVADTPPEMLDAGDLAAVVDETAANASIVDGGLNDAPDGGTAVTTLANERDRLLDTLATDRCVAWAALDDDQRAIFLLVTDLLGKRTLLDDGDSALAHVMRVHALRGRQHEGCLRCCGDREFNRAYLSLDDALIAAFRDDALPSWRDTRDLAGPHAPFTASSETELGQPRGQAHFFAADDDAVALDRPGVEGVLDAHALELDLDFNLLHESAPTCEYGGESGLSRYQALWGEHGAGGDAELTYVPGGC